MPPKTPEDILGLEFDWLASDADGNVAFFSTAGGGYAPPGFLEDTEIHDRAIDAILEIPRCTKARFAPQVASESQNTWRRMAQRGFFAFDADAQGGPYVLAAAPEQPVHLSTLPEAVALVIGELRFGKLRFSETEQLSAEILQSQE